METPARAVPKVGRGLEGRRVVLAMFGSLGDLHPFIALAKGLQSRGCAPVIATSESHRGRVDGQGIAFHPTRPHLMGLDNDPELYRRAMDLKRGPEFVTRELFMRHVRESYDDLLAAAERADLLVSHTIAFAGPLVAEVTGVPWLSVVLAPMMFFSKFDPSVLSPAPWLRHLRRLGPAFWGPLLGVAKWSARSWSEPVRALRAEVGLPPCRVDPLFEGVFSPEGTLALFSPVLGAPQPDWPAGTVQTGFAFFDDPNAEGLSAELRRFLDAGAPPLVFTLGSSAAWDAGPFYEESLAAALRIGRRAVLVIGTDPRNRPRGPLPGSAIAVEYAPFSELFPRAAAIVHQGGVGTTGQALRSGRPMLVVPWSHDQPDNAERVCRLGVARTLSRARYHTRAAAGALRRLLNDQSYAARADQFGRRVRAEEGVSAACDAIERRLAASPREGGTAAIDS